MTTDLRVQDALRVRDTFLAIAAHEIRTPLTVMLGFAQLLHMLAEHEWTNREQYYLGMILAKGRELTTIADALIDLDQIVQGRLHLAMQLTPIDACIQSVVGDISINNPGHMIVVTNTDPQAKMIGDKTRVETILFHILENAVKYTPGGGTIVVRADTTHDTIIIAVHDAGIGIPVSSLPHVFEQYYRAPNVGNETTGIAGLGLGLYVARELVHAHGGAIVAFSQGENRGTTVTVAFPKVTRDKP